MYLNVDTIKTLISQRADLPRFKFLFLHFWLTDGKFFFSCSDIDALVGGEVGGLEFGKLPFGACEDPIRCEFHYII